MKFNKSILGAVLALLLIPVTLWAQPAGEMPDVATLEVQRRGDLVERVGGISDESIRNYTSAMAPPADDSNKWFITVITSTNCPPCAKLRQDFGRSPDLAPFVNVVDPSKSWAHYHVFVWGDATQQWRWKEIQVRGFPTILLQPPRNGKLGDPKTVVWQKTGYDGNPKQLATDLRAAIYRYVQQLQTPRRGAVESAPSNPQWGFRESTAQKKMGIQQQAGNYQPPFTPPPQVDPNPAPAFPNLPAEWPPQTPTPPSPTNAVGLLLQILFGCFASGTLQNLLLLVIAGLIAVQAFRKPTPVIVDVGKSSATSSSKK